MILIFDDNEYRRQELCKKMYMADLFVRGESYEHCEYLAKPLVTVLISPDVEQIKYFSSVLMRQNTIPVLVIKRSIPEARLFRNVIIDENGEITPKQIIDIIKKETEYNLFHDMINYILVDEEEKDIYFGGKKLFLTDGEYKIVKFFAYNREKMFIIDEILDYLHLRKRVSENTFYVYISNINSKCYDQHREDIIIRTTYGYGISKVTGKFKP